jgi:hypothetical protein
MQRAKQLKNADQILRRLLPTLEYPFAMQQMLATGDFQSVLTIYRRVQSLPVASGLRIVKRITNRADVIMFEMKQKILSILLAPSPVLPVLTRLVKILHEMEDEENCRLILQQCYEKQILTFEDQMKSIVHKACEELMRAYMRGQELNLMNKDPSLRGGGEGGVGGHSPKLPPDQRKARVVIPPVSPYLVGEGVNPPARRKTAAWIRSNAARRRQSQTTESLANEAMRSLSLYEGLSDSIFDTDSGGGGEGDGGGDESLDYEGGAGPDDLSESDSVASSDTTTPGGNTVKRSAEEDELLYQDPTVDYSEHFTKRVRVKMTRQLIDVIDLWLPSVHRLLMLLTAAPQTPSSSSAVATGGGGGNPPSSVKLSLPSQPNNTLASRRVSVALPNRVLQTTYGRNQSVAVQAKQLGDVLVTCSEAIRGCILGFKGKYLSLFLNELFVTKMIFSQAFMQAPLQDPHLSTTVMEISEVYDVIETVLMDPTRHELSATTPLAPSSLWASDDLDSVNFFGSTAYRDSIHMLRALAEDGENTIAKKTMEQLLSQALVLTSRVSKKPSASSSSVPSSGASKTVPLPLEGDHFLSPSSSSRTIDDIVRVFEVTCLKRLRRLVEVVRRPDWVASTVWDNTQRLLDRFISSLALVAGTNNESQKKGLEVCPPSPSLRLTTAQRSNTFLDDSDLTEVKMRISLELEMLELSLMVSLYLLSRSQALQDTQHVQATKNQNLDFIRACVRLRTQTVSNV